MGVLRVGYIEGTEEGVWVVGVRKYSRQVKEVKGGMRTDDKQTADGLVEVWQTDRRHRYTDWNRKD